MCSANSAGQPLLVWCYSWVIWPHTNGCRFGHSDGDNIVTQAEAKAILLLPSWLAKRDDSGTGGEDSKLKTSGTQTYCYWHKPQGAVDFGSDIAKLKSKEQLLRLLSHLIWWSVPQDLHSAHQLTGCRVTWANLLL